MSTLESGSSVQSTGTSWTRSPHFSARTSSSVSKNQALSTVCGSSCRATSARMALKPHCASLKWAPMHGLQQEVVAAGDELALGPADHPGIAGQPGADGQVGMPGNQRGEQGAQRREVGGEVHVHVGQDGRRRGEPHFAEGVAAALLREMDHCHLAQLPGHPLGGLEGAVGAGVVRHGDPERVREGAPEIGVQPAQALPPGPVPRCRPGWSRPARERAARCRWVSAACRGRERPGSCRADGRGVDPARGGGGCSGRGCGRVPVAWSVRVMASTVAAASYEGFRAKLCRGCGSFGSGGRRMRTLPGRAGGTPKAPDHVDPGPPRVQNALAVCAGLVPVVWRGGSSGRRRGSRSAP